MKGLMDWIIATPGPPTTESIVLEKVLNSMWREMTKDLDVTKPFMVFTSNTRRRRTWRGRRFSYLTNWGVALKQMGEH